MTAESCSCRGCGPLSPSASACLPSTQCTILIPYYATVTSAGKVASGLERFVVVEPAAFLCSGLQEIDTMESGQKAGRKWVESRQKAEKKQVKSGLEAG